MRGRFVAEPPSLGLTFRARLRGQRHLDASTIRMVNSVQSGFPAPQTLTSPQDPYEVNVRLNRSTPSVATNA